MPLLYDTPDPPIEHYNYDEVNGDPVTPQCGCFLCKNWWHQLAVVKAIEPTEELSHPPYCMCDSCRILRTERTKLTAEGVRRDAYSELSYVVRDKEWKSEFLAWFVRKIKTSRQSDASVAFKTDRITLGEWVNRWAISTGRIK